MIFIIRFYISTIVCNFIIFFFFIIQADFVRAQSNNGRVNFRGASENLRLPFNPYTEFDHGVIRYRIPVNAESRRITITIAGQNHTIDIGLFVQVAINEWQIAAPGITFVPAGEGLADLIFEILPVMIGAYGQSPFAVTSFNRFTGRSRQEISQTTVTFYQANFENEIEEHLALWRTYLGQVNEVRPQAILAFIARFVAIHEFGHILGFHHPDAMPDSDLAVPGRSNIVTILQENTNSEVAIMTREPRDYARYIYERNNHTPIHLGNIVISSQERTALSIVREGPQSSHCSCRLLNVMLMGGIVNSFMNKPK